MLTHAARRTNDTTFAQPTRTSFPQLALIRVLSCPLLATLERNNGPEAGKGAAHWERWDAQCRAQGVRLEDCTGAPLGELPEDEDALALYEYDSEAEEIVEERERARAGEKPDGLQPANVDELRRLIAEIRELDTRDAMDETFASLNSELNTPWIAGQ